MSGPKRGTPERAALVAYPRRPEVQRHWLRGFYAAKGDPVAQAALVGSYAEQSGASVAVLHP